MKFFRRLPHLNSHVLILLSITLFGAFIRLYNLGHKSLWLDEAVIYQISQGSIQEVILKNSQHNSAPPLFPLLINAVSRVGDSEAFLRLIPAFAGIAAIPICYLFAKQVMSDSAALATAFIVAVSTTQVRYSQQLREYSLTFLLSFAALFSVCHFLRSKGRWSSWLLMVIAFSLSIFTQYGLVVLVVALNFVFLVAISSHDDKRNLVSKWMLAQLICAMAVVVVYEVALKEQYQPGGFAGASYLSKAYWQGGTLRSLMAFALKNTRELIDFAFHSAELFPLLVGVGLVTSLRKDRRSLAFSIFVASVSVTFVLASIGIFPYHGGRQTIFLTPMIYMAFGLGIAYLWMIDRGRIIAGAILLVLGVSGLLTRPTGVIWHLRSTTPEHSRPVINDLKESYRSGDAIYANYLGGYALRYYLREDARNVDISSINFLNSSGDVAIADINESISHPGRYWIFLSHCDSECNAVREYVADLESSEEASINNGVWLYLITND